MEILTFEHMSLLAGESPSIQVLFSKISEKSYFAD